MRNQTICILLPGRLDKPVGGHKIIYQYANMLSDDGFEVIVANNVFLHSSEGPIIECLRRINALIRFLYRAAMRKNSCRTWFSLSEKVKEKSVWSFNRAPKAGYYIATAAVSARYLMSYDIPDSRKIYFIQGYENWQMTDRQLRETYKYPFKKVVASKWLRDIVDKEGERSYLVPNGFSTKEYRLEIPIEDKNRYCISMLYHTAGMKNVELGFSALSKIKDKYPQLKVLLFGVYEKPQDLPEWYSYYQCPDIKEHNRINNEAAIYIGTSNSEGWGLTVGEAMLCGQAVACTDTKGYLEMAVDGETALVSPVGNVEAMASNIIRLIEDDNLRCRVARNGNERIQSFSLSNSYRQFKKVLLDE